MKILDGQKTARARLKHVHEGGSQVLELRASGVTLGRNNACDLVISAQEVSRLHCAVEEGPDGWYVCDRNSRNGTFLNGERVERHILTHGDTIAFDPNGRNTVVFEDGDGSPDSAIETGVLDDEGNLDSSIIAARLDVIDVEQSLVLRPSSIAEVTQAQKMPDAAAAASATPSRRPASTSVVALFGQMGEILLTSGTLDIMLSRVLDLVFQMLPAQRGSIYLYDDETESLTEKAARHDAGKAPLTISKSIVNEVIKAKKALLVRDAMDDARFSSAMSIVQYEIRSALCAPMYHQGRVMGLIYVDIQGDVLAFTELDLELLTALAVFAATGLEQWRLRENVERERGIRTRLARYSSPMIVEQIVSSDTSLDEEMLAEEKEVTVLFADLQGFTSMSEDMSPADVASVLNAVFGRLTEIIFRFEGTLDKFIGDAIMGIFGAPLSLSDHAVRAIEAALMMQESLEELNRKSLYEGSLKMRIGINSGLVVAGDLGSPERKDYTVLGDAVNVASRLESSVARAGQIVVGPKTYEQASGKFEFELLPEIQLKGKQRSVRPYLVRGPL